MRSLNLVRTLGVLTVLLQLWAGAWLPVAWADQPNSQAERAQLESQLQQIEQQINELTQELKTTTAQKNTLTAKLNQLKKQQAALQLQIKATNLKLQDLGSRLSETKDAITTELVNLERVKTEMSGVLVAVHQQDELPLWYRVGASQHLAQVFDNLEGYVQLLGGLQQGLTKVKQAREVLEGKQELLTEQQDETKSLLEVKALQQQQLLTTVNQHATLLNETKGRESAYQNELTDTKKRAAQIRSRIYQLLDVSTQITFGQAYQIASWVSQQTGVRPALLLAVLTQESNLGRNVGTCNRKDDPPQKKWQVIMKPERDQKPFLAITRELGMDPDVTPVSCPMRDAKGNQVGWGGAMGPAQFIPSTWVGYKDKVSALTGKSPANPWDIRDAFVASAVKLKADGANGTRQGEWNAAMRYFSGSTNVRYRFYGDSVQKLADGYQEDIDALSK